MSDEEKTPSLTARELEETIQKACEDYMKKYNFDGIGYGLSKQRCIDDFFAGARWGMFASPLKYTPPSEKAGLSDA